VTNNRLTSEHKSLAELYAELLIRQRGIVREQGDNGAAVCQHCKGQRRNHDHEGRCSIAVTSLKFRDVRRDELNRIGDAITLIEKLREL